MKHQHDEKMMNKIAEQLGNDFNAKVIAEVAEHMRECPDCKIYVDSVKQTIKLYRVTESESSVPEDVSDRLFTVLKLDSR
ncbi:MAG: hypothetical protein KAK01_07435 [Candidatus Marinimicrobia bacterium]|nr:hypothetical protein [Candidatus Neomarinimicrobiota bacterium]